MRRWAAALAVVVAVLAAGAGTALARPLGVVPDGAPPARAHAAAGPVAHSASLPYAGGGVLHSNRTFLVFWLPAGAGLSFDPGYVALLERFTAGVAHDSHLQSNVYSLTGQYSDPDGRAAYSSSDGGAILDTDPLPPRDVACQEPLAPPLGEGPGWPDCVTDDQIQAELTHLAIVRHLPTSPQNVYLLITPAGLGDCVTGSTPVACSLGGPDNGGYCGYHSAVGGSDQVYAVIPYNAVDGHCQSTAPRPNGSTADPTLSTLSHEHIEAITDPFATGWLDSHGNEMADLCIDMTEHRPRAIGSTAKGPYDQTIDGGHYWLQQEWSNADGGCAQRAQPDSLQITAPPALRAGVRFAVRATGGDPQGRLTGVRWTFGDRTSGHGFRTTHAFRRAGRYPLIARATDSWGNWVYARRTVRVRAPVRRVG